MATTKRNVPAKTNTRTIEVPPEGDNPMERLVADMVVAGTCGNATTMHTFARGTFDTLDLASSVRSLASTIKDVQAGNLGHAEAVLTSQAVALDAIFGEMARRAALNMGEYPDAFERYMRLALKAQTQCRATLETLATIKHPPVVIARQANIAHGPQQVNNLPTTGSSPAGEGVQKVSALPSEDRTVTQRTLNRDFSPVRQ